MRNVFIVLITAIVLGAIGWVGTMEISRQMQNADAEQVRPAARTGDEGMRDALRDFNRASGDLAKRQTYGLIGGGVGIGAGIILGYVIGASIDRGKRGVKKVKGAP